MSTAAIIDALALPADARVNQRISKKLLLAQGAKTAADKRYIQEGIQEALWIAALKPTTIGIPAYRDDVREYLEIAVVAAVIRPAAKIDRLTELMHRAIPYPLLLLTDMGGMVRLSLAHKRFSQAEAGRVVAEEVVETEPFNPETLFPLEAAFLASLALSGLPPANLLTVYQGWIDRVIALAAAHVTGKYALAASTEQAESRRRALADRARILQEIAGLRSQAEQETQINRRVEMNLDIKRLEAELEDTFRNL